MEFLSAAKRPILVTACLLFWTARASAGGPIGANGQPVTTSEYSLDLFQGPLFAGSRVTGLAGAYVAIAEDVDGDLQNPAAPAVRPFFSYTHFDYWLGFGLTFPADIAHMDFFNSGSKTRVANPPNAFVFFTPAVNLQWGELGIGVNLALQQYALAPPEEGARRGITATIPTTHIQVAHGFDHNQLVLGAGVRLVAMTVTSPDVDGYLFQSSGPGVEVGAVWKPEHRPIRLGVAYRTPIVTRATFSENLLPNANGDLIIRRSDGTPIYLPKAVASPWDFNFGFAYQWGREINPRWRPSDEAIQRLKLEHQIKVLDLEQARRRALSSAKTSAEQQAIEEKFERDLKTLEDALQVELLKYKTLMERELTAMNRFYLQISGSMVLSGSVEDAIGVEGLVNQTVHRSGEKVVLSPRVGIEAGVIPNWLKVRGGSYLEPTRFDSGDQRLHVTAGLDVKLLVWNVFGLWPNNYMWRLGLGGDAARDYYTWGLTIAGWYPRHENPEDVPDFSAQNK